MSRAARLILLANAAAFVVGFAGPAFAKGGVDGCADRLRSLHAFLRGSEARGRVTSHDVDRGTLHLRLSGRAAVAINIRRREEGRRIGGRCLSVAAAGARPASRCRRWVQTASYADTYGGAVGLRVSCLVGGRPGVYRIAVRDARAWRIVVVRV